MRMFLLGLLQTADFSSILINYHYWKLCLIFSSVHLHRLWRIFPILFGFSMFIWIEKINSSVLFLFRLFIYLFLLCVESEPKELSCMLLRAKQRTEKCKVSQGWRELASWVLVLCTSDATDILFNVTCLHEVDNYFYILNTLLFWRTFALKRLLRRYSWEEFKPSSKVEMSRIY